MRQQKNLKFNTLQNVTHTVSSLFNAERGK